MRRRIHPVLGGGYIPYEEEDTWFRHTSSRNQPDAAFGAQKCQAPHTRVVMSSDPNTCKQKKRPVM
jgi:hypothetical protein